jgi:DNA-nicking Smr family endonuclease
MTEDKIKHPTSNDDSQLFRTSVGEIKRIQSDKVAPSPLSSKPNKQLKTRQQYDVKLSITYEQAVEGNESVFFSHDGVNGKTTKRMKRGDIQIADAIDLHGLTEKSAENSINQFITSSYSSSHRYIMVVHGKGHGSNKKYPVLKNLVVNLLSSHPDVLAFTSAIQSDGGTGALYVLLKK